MRLMHIIGSRGGGGAENFYLRLVPALMEAGDEILAVAPPGSRIADALDPRIPQCPMAMRGVWDLWARWQIRQAIRAFRPDIVQTWMGRATRLVSLPRGEAPVHLARLGGYYDLKGYRHAHAWVGNTRGIHTYLVEQGLPEERVFHIGNFVEPAPTPEAAQRTLTRNRLGIPLNALLVVSVGRLHPNKGFSDLLQAFSGLPESLDQRPLWLLIAGDGELSIPLQQQAHRLGIAGRLCWAGWQTDVGPLLDVADLFVCPSRHEPLGNVILEAWAHGLPVVTTATHGALELATDKTDAMLTPCADATALTAAMRGVLDHAEVRAALGAAGHATLQREYGKQDVVARYRALYQQLAELS